ncbi:hypothetical protein [Vibrio quintilis]|nr:hypothetical protein [Vibrio quintilis]
MQFNYFPGGAKQVDMFRITGELSLHQHQVFTDFVVNIEVSVFDI